MNEWHDWMKKVGLRWLMDYEIYKAVDMTSKQKWRINIRLIHEQMGIAPLLNKWNLNWEMIHLKKEATWILVFARIGGPTLSPAAGIKSLACYISVNHRYVQICTCHAHYNQHFYNTNSTYQVSIWAYEWTFELWSEGDGDVVTASRKDAKPETGVWDSISTLVCVKPLNIFNKTSGYFQLCLWQQTQLNLPEFSSPDCG